MSFSAPLDIANRALQRLGKNQTAGLAIASDEAFEANFGYDKLRLAELQRNLWSFPTKRTILRAIGTDTVLWTPPAWAAGTYSVGAVVSYTPTNGPYANVASYWQTDVAKTASNTTSPDLDSDWHHYTGPVALDLYDSSQTYAAGEVVLIPSTWSSGTTYAANDVVAYNNVLYVSLLGSNTNQTPSTATTYWVKWTTSGRASGSYGLTTNNTPVPLTYPGTPSIYLSLYNSNADGPLSGNGTWLSLVGTVEAYGAALQWPMGSGPSYDPTSLYAYYLPHGYLKRAPTSPKAGLNHYLGAASGVLPDDLTPEGRHLLVSSAPGPVELRFVADVTDVTAMDPMFCEGLSARIAMELAFTLSEKMTEGLARKNSAMRDYNLVMNEARTANAIEIGPVTPIEGRYITARA